MKKFRRRTPVYGSLLVFPLLLFAPPAFSKFIDMDQKNTRSGPSLRGTSIFTVPLGYSVEIEKEKADRILFRDRQNKKNQIFTPIFLDTKTKGILVGKAAIRNSTNQSTTAVGLTEQGEIWKSLSHKGNGNELGYL